MRFSEVPGAAKPVSTSRISIYENPTKLLRKLCARESGLKTWMDLQEIAEAIDGMHRFRWPGNADADMRPSIKAPQPPCICSSCYRDRSQVSSTSYLYNLSGDLCHFKRKLFRQGEYFLKLQSCLLSLLGQQEGTVFKYLCLNNSTTKEHPVNCFLDTQCCTVIPTHCLHP